MQHCKLLLIIWIALCPLFTVAQSGSGTLDSVQQANLRTRALTLDSIVRANPQRQTNSFNAKDTTSLPIGIVKEIGGVIYVICIDSARFTPNGATFDVYMAMDWPGSYGKLAFAAKRIPFNPKGVLGGGNEDITLKLIGDQTLRLGPKNRIVFKGDGSNYIQWGCNGYERVNINADIIFSEELIHKPGGGSVKANLQANIEDLKNIMFQTSIDPFVVSGLEDFVFTANQVTVDRSESVNPANITLPQVTESLYDTLTQWKGFYAHTLTLTLPPKLSRSTGPTSLGVMGLIIDDNGVTGDFFAANIFSTQEGNMDKWLFSLDSLVLGLENNKLVDGRIAGLIEVPQLDDEPLKYRAAISRPSETAAYHYDFSIRTVSSKTYSMGLFNSTLILANNCGIDVHIENNKFVPTLTLNGKLTYNGQKAHLDKLTFQNLKLSTKAPYILGGTFALTSSDTTTTQQADTTQNHLARIPISINQITLGLSQSQVVLGVGLSMKLGGNENHSSFGVTTGIQVVTKRQTEPNSTRERLVYDRLKVNDIALNVSTNAFALAGVISIRNDDPDYGDLFFGSIGFKINSEKLMPGWTSVSAGFGRLNNNRYWYLDAAAPTTIPLGGFALITNMMGGVQYGVQSTLTSTQKLDRAFNGALTNNYTAPNGAAAPIPFVPNPAMGLGFSAGVALVASTGEGTFNGEAIFSIQFNTNVGLANIGFDGRAFMLTRRSFRNSPTSFYGMGTLNANYDHNNQVFDAGLAVTVAAPNVLYGNCALTIHIDSTDWYFWLNRPTNRATLNVLNVFQANAYFMIGTQIDPIPAPPSYVTNLVSSSPIISTDMSQVSAGQGFATGMLISVSFDGEFPKNTDWRGYVAVGVGAGFDITMFKLAEGSHCVGNSSAAGMNGWYCVGQVYTWLNGSLGARKYRDGELRNEYSVCSINAGALLQGRLPKPTYVYGAIGFEVSLIGIINFDFTADIAFGNDCQIVN